MHPFFIDCPEEVVNHPFTISRVDTSSNEKESYILTSAIINEIFSNYSIITEEKSQINVLKNIIIPQFSQMIFTPNSDIINSKLIFHFYESLSNLFLERYQAYLSDVIFFKKSKNDFAYHASNENGNETIEKLRNTVNLKIQTQTNSNTICLSFFQSNLKPNNTIKLINLNPTDSSLLADSFLWSIYHSNLDVLFRCFEKTFLFKNVDVNKFKNSANINKLNEKTVIFQQNFPQSTIEINQNLLESNFVYNKNRLNSSSPRTCHFAANPHYLLVFNSSENISQKKHFLKINLCNHNMSENNRFITTTIKLTENYFVAPIVNDAIISNKSGNLFISNHNCPVLDTFSQIKQSIPLPFTTDGYYIYSIHSKKEIGVYELDKAKNSLTLVKKIFINDCSNLSGNYKDAVISNELIKKANLLTNGIVLEFIVQERVENNNFVHFGRRISLINGNHIQDYNFILPFPIHTLSFDPVSRRIWTLTVREQESIFNQFKYKGPEPFWLSKFEISSFTVSPKFSNYNDFVDTIINYVHSVVCQFFGYDFEKDDQVPDFLKAFSSSDMIDLVLCLLDQPPQSIKYVQLLFIFLSFQFKYKKVKKEQINYLYNSVRKYFTISHLYNFLVLFMINIASNLKSNDLSRFFELIFKFYDKNIHDLDLIMSLLLRYEKSKRFPFFLENPELLHELFYQLNGEEISMTGVNFLMSYQASVFLNYARIYKTKTQKIQKIEYLALNYTTSIFSVALIFIQNVKSLEDFDHSIFLLVMKKLLMDLRLTAHLSSFISSLLPILLKFLKKIPQLKFFKENVGNSFYTFYIFVFSLYVFCFKRMFSFSNIDVIKNHYPFLDVQIQKEKTIPEIFENKLNDAGFNEVINAIYTKVPNPINKHLTTEDKEFEKLIFLSIIFKTNAIEEVNQLNNEIKENKNNIKIPQSLRQIAQTIYKIRSNLKLKRQNGKQNIYHKLYNNYTEKSHFLLTFTNSQKFSLKEISDFLNNDAQVSLIIQEQIKLESVKEKLYYFIPMAYSFITENLPKSLIYFFIMNIAESGDILASNEILKKYVTIDLQVSKELINNLIEQMNIMPPNAILSFICYLFFVLLASFKLEDIHSLIYESILNILMILIKKSNNIEKIVFESCISIICNLINIFNKEKLFVMTPEEKENLTNVMNNLDLKNSMSLELSHSFFIGSLYKNIHPQNIEQLLGYIGQPEFHQITLLLFDHLQIFSDNNQEKEFMKLFEQILEIIGTVLSGSNSKRLLQIAVPVQKIEQITNNRFIRTPTSQLSCILDLIQIVRRFILESESNASKMILNHFKSISEHFHQDNLQYMKQLYAMLSIMSNAIKIIRPFTLVKTIDNKTYFVTTLEEEDQKLKGILLPVSKQQFYKHELDVSSDLKSFEFIQYNLSLLKNFELPFSLFKKALNIEKEQPSYSLFKIYTLHWIKENILDHENGKEFNEKFFNKIKNRIFKNFVFSDHLNLILSLLKKSLILETEGVFASLHQKPKFFHASFTNIVFEKDYLLTENKFKAIKSPHVFISSIICDSKPIFLGIKYEKLNQDFAFGIIAHSIEHNKMISIKYSSQQSKFFINGEKASDYKLKANTLIECLYFPSKNLVSFADSNNNNSVIFSVFLGQKLKCSFLVLVYPGSEIQYSCDLTPQTNCFINHQNTKFTNINQGITVTSLLFQKDYTEELEGIIHYSSDFKEIKYRHKDNLNIELDIVNNNEKTTLFTLTEFKNLPETDLFLANHPNSYFYSVLDNFSTPIQLNQYIQVHEVSGTFNLIESRNAVIENLNSIPAFDIQKYYNLPSDIINCYVTEACELYQKEIMTLFAVQVFSNSKDIYSSLNHFSMSTLAVVNFITSVLFLLEPIKFSNLNDKKSPIDFLEFNGLKVCSKPELYDYFTALTQIVDFITENDLEKFTYKWFKQLQTDFRSKYMHFVSQKNNDIINVRSSIIDSYQTFNLDNVSGWIVFPYKFGLYKTTQLSINHVIFPKLPTDAANYIYTETKILKIKLNNTTQIRNNDDLTTYGIIPIFNKSNESLFYSFYHLAVSFKYFVLFTQNKMPYKMKQQIWKLVINSIAAGSPFFFSHSHEVLTFLQNKIQLEMNSDSVAMLNSLHISNSILENPSVRRFLFYQSHYLTNEMSKKLAYYIFEKDEMAPKNIKVTNPIIPNKLDKSVNTEILVDVVSSVLLYKENNEQSFPYYYVIHEWTNAFLCLPPSIVENVSENVFKITFLLFIPNTFQLISDGSYNSCDVLLSTTNDFSNCNERHNSYSIRASNDYINQYKIITQETPNTIFYVKYLCSTNISSRKHTVYSYVYSRNFNVSEIIYSFRSYIKTDLKDFNKKFSQSDDQQILSTVLSDKFTRTPMETRPSTFEIGKMLKLKHPPHLIYFRAIYLFTLNYLFLNEKSMSEKSNSDLERYFSKGIFSSHFMKLIDAHNLGDYSTLSIDRQKGLDYRNGINNLVQNSMIAQFSESYLSKPNFFRNKTTPFKIRYLNERGIDAGGLMRDFFTELISDIKTPRVGLFIQTPNGRNHEGNFQDCLVPAPAPEISKSDRYYQSIGALIAISIRTEMKQPDLIFPSFFWSFIITGKLKIEDIYEIDNSYKNVTMNLLQSSNEMTDEEFENLMSLTTVLNLRGNPIRINIGNNNSSSSIRLSKSDCARFVAFCNDFRLNELINPLTKIREGFWQNLAVEPPPFVTPSLLELMACGNRVITADDLRAVTRFNGVPDTQKNYFWQVVERMNNEERKKLVHFSTGLNSLNNRGLSIDNLGNQHLDHLPTASTCFFSLHLPPYSSAERMYNAFIIAINETGTFENA